MTVVDKYYYKLVDEFSNIRIKIDFGTEHYTGEVIHDPEEDDYYPTFREYTFYFQDIFFIKRDQEGNYPIEYAKHVEELRLKFNRELNDEIENLQDPLELLNLLIDYKLRFSDLINSNYFIGIYEDGIKTMDNERIKYECEDNLVLKSPTVRRIKSAFLWVQINEINKILETLNEKIRLVESYSVGGKKITPVKKAKSALEKLDLYQTALLFFYLNEVGAIRYNSSNEIAPIVNLLTGHSPQNLRTEAFSKIVDVKRGVIGKRTELSKNPSYNLQKIEELIIELHQKIRDDLAKNTETEKL